MTERLVITLDDVHLGPNIRRDGSRPAAGAAAPGPPPVAARAKANETSADTVHISPTDLGEAHPPSHGVATAGSAPAAGGAPAAAPAAQPGTMSPGATLDVELVVAPLPGQHWRAPGIDVWVSSDHRHVAPSAPEHVRERFRFVGGAWGTGFDPNGTTDVDGRLRPLFEGGGQLAITDRRIVGFSRTGAALGQAIAPHLGLLVCWQLPLSAVGEVALARRPGREGIPSGLDVWVLGSRPALLRLDEVVTEGPTEGGLDPARRAMQTIVSSAASHQASPLSEAQRSEVLHPEDARWLDPSYSATAEWLRQAGRPLPPPPGQREGSST